MEGDSNQCMKDRVLHCAKDGEERRRRSGKVPTFWLGGSFALFALLFPGPCAFSPPVLSAGGDRPSSLFVASGAGEHLKLTFVDWNDRATAVRTVETLQAGLRREQTEEMPSRSVPAFPIEKWI
jgi:hypothetical protein